MNPKLLDKLLKIRQGNAIWQCTVRRAPVWITPKDRAAYRPFILLVVDQDSEMILKTEITEKRPDPQTVLENLFKIMQGTLFTLLAKQRPARISIDDAGLAQACAPQLAELGIRCEQRATLPQLKAALLELETSMNGREPVPGLLSIQGASLPLVAELYAAAAEFYRQAPWRWLENWMPIEVCYPASGKARYALVLGSGGDTFGVSLYESLADLEVVFAHTEPDQPFSRPIICFSLVLEAATVMTYDDLDAIERYGWPVAAEEAYPLVIKATSRDDDFSALPTASEIAWLAATLRALPIFASQYLHADRGRPQPAQASLALPDIHGNQQIALRYPAGGAMRLAQTQDPELDAYIAGWSWDEKSHEFALEMGRFLFQFLDHLDESNLSEQTMRKHESNCWLIGAFECDYGDHDTFSPAIFLSGPEFIVEFKHKVSDSKSALTSYEATWRKLEKYVNSLDE